MYKFLKNISLIPTSLKYKLILAFSLMSVIPLLLCLILINKYVYGQQIIIGNISLLILITAIIAVLGLYIAKSIVDPIVEMARKVKLLLSGRESEGIITEREDEIGDLSGSINSMASRLNKNVDDLKAYEERIRKINMEINKKVTSLSILFQVSNIMSTTKELNVILQTVTERFPDVIESEKSFLVMLDKDAQKMNLKATNNLTPEEIEVLEEGLQKGILSRLTKQKDILLSDNKHKPNNIIKNLNVNLNLRNIIIFPIILHGEVEGAMILGNNKEAFTFKEDELDLIKVFGKQISIAIENNWLMKKTEELSVKDELTGLFNFNYLKGRLKEEIQRAITYQRPCSFVVFQLDNFDIYQDKFGAVASDQVLKKVAPILKANVEQVDKVGRFDNYNFALILPEKNKKEAHMIADKIRERIRKFKFEHQESMPGKNLTISAVVTANPVDGMSAEELMAKARDLLKKEESKGNNTIYT